MTAKSALFVLALTCTLLQWMGMRSAIAYWDYHALALEVAQGRMETADTGRISGLLNTQPRMTEALSPDVARTRAILNIYAMDIAAVARGFSPLQPTEDTELIQTRQTALQSLRSVLAIAPHDGELWMRLALVGTSLALPKDQIIVWLSKSERTAPHESWILRRREILHNSWL